MNHCPESVSVCRQWHGVWIRIALLCVVGLPVTAQAALGDSPGALELERVRLQASVQTITGMAYSTVEMQTPLGIAIREYVANNGQVFAVSWKGPFKPDLRNLLGPYFAAFQNAPRAVQARHSRTQSLVATPEVVVHSAGRPRAFAGIAWLPALVPAGVDPAGLQ
jgi:hypothetical protein